MHLMSMHSSHVSESDYNKLMDFTIPMGEPSACSPLTAVADGVVEHTETLLVSIDSDAEDVSGNAIVVIIDVDGTLILRLLGITIYRLLFIHGFVSRSKCDLGIRGSLSSGEEQW